MNGNDNLVWILLGLGALFFFWRAIWGLAVMAGVVAALVYIWGLPGHSDSAKLIASGIAIAAGSLFFPKRKNSGGTTKEVSKATPYRLICSACGGSGRKPCIHCHGTGETMDSKTLVLGPKISCPHCLGGFVRCGCGT